MGFVSGPRTDRPSYPFGPDVARPYTTLARLPAAAAMTTVPAEASSARRGTRLGSGGPATPPIGAALTGSGDRCPRPTAAATTRPYRANKPTIAATLIARAASSLTPIPFVSSTGHSTARIPAAETASTTARPTVARRRPRRATTP